MQKYLNNHQQRRARPLCTDSQHDLCTPTAIVEAIISGLPDENFSIPKLETTQDDAIIKMEAQLNKLHQKLVKIQAHQPFAAGIHAQNKNQDRGNPNK